MNEETKPLSAEEELRKSLEDYIQFLEDAYSNTYGIAHIHGYREKVEGVEKGKQLRERIKSRAHILTTSQTQGSESELNGLREENERLKTVMIAAAEEITAHWDAHCDHEGYGPVNLMHRLEKGIPEQYGYTAGEFAKLQSRIKELESSSSAGEGEGQEAVYVECSWQTEFGLYEEPHGEFSTWLMKVPVKELFKQTRK